MIVQNVVQKYFTSSAHKLKVQFIESVIINTSNISSELASAIKIFMKKYCKC